MDAGDDWQEMPVIASGSTTARPTHRRRRSTSSDRNQARSDDDDDDDDVPPSLPHYHAYHTSSFSSRRPMTAGILPLSSSKRSTGKPGGSHSAPLTNATGTSLKLNDARGYDWRSKPAGAPGMHSSRQTDNEQHDKTGVPQRLRADHNSDDDSEEESDDEKGQGYTQLRLDEDLEGDQLHDATAYLFGDSATSAAAKEDPALGYSLQNESTATPLSQMMTTKSLLSESQKIAYVGLCALKAKEMVRAIKRVPGASKELSEGIKSIEEWEIKVMARLFQHMDIDASEQAMIKSLGEHGVLASDLAPSLVTTQQIENPDYDPIAAQEKADAEQERIAQESQNQARQESQEAEQAHEREEQDAAAVSERSAATDATVEADVLRSQADNVATVSEESSGPSSATEDSVTASEREADTLAQTTTSRTIEDEILPEAKGPSVSSNFRADPNSIAQATALDATMAAVPIPPNHLGLTAESQSVQPLPSALPGVTTELSTSDTHITLDLRWTVLCDLFLVMTADSVYDARSRVLLERVAEQLGLTWMDVTKFEKRVTDALEIEEGIEKLKDKTAISRRQNEAAKKKWAMIGLATVGGGLVIGLSAGLAAPLVGAGLAGFLGTVGVGGTTTFLSGVGGAALITTTGAVGGAAIGGRGMSRRTQSVRTFAFKPIHNNKRVNCIVTVPGFMNGDQDDVRLPFSVIDSIMGDVFSVLWEPEMMKEMGNAIHILYNETLVMGVQSVLAATIAGGLLGALAWPLWLTKLGYLIDNPWSNATTRAEAAGKILADVLARRQLGVRPITLVGFSLGARAIFFALHELAKKKAYGVVQNVYLFGAPVTANDRTWKEVRSVVAGRFVNGFSRTDWILGYLFRATSGGLRSIAGLHPVERVPEIENVDVTNSVPGHLQYRAFMPLVMSEVGFKVTQDWFDEPEDLSKIPDRQVILDDLAQEEEEKEMKTINTKSGGFGRIFRRKKGDTGLATGSSTSGTNSTDVSRPSTPGKVTTTVAGGIVVPRKAEGGIRQEYDEDNADADDDDYLPPREGDHSSSISREPQQPESSSQPVSAPLNAVVQAVPVSPEMQPATPEIELPPGRSTYVDTAAVLAELRESGIEVKELQSSLPALSLASAPSSPVIKEPHPSAAPASDSQADHKERVNPASAVATKLAEPARPSLRSSMSSLFGSRKASFVKARSDVAQSTKLATPQESTPVSPAGSALPETPSLSVPGSAYALGGTPIASSSARTSHMTRALSNHEWEDAPSQIGPSDTTPVLEFSDKAWAKPFNAAASLQRDLPLQPPSYVAPSNVNLSFASDFDDGGDLDDSREQQEKDSDTQDSARNYGLSVEAARELAQRFSNGASEVTVTPSSAVPAVDGNFVSGGWESTPMNMAASDSRNLREDAVLPSGSGSSTDWESGSGQEPGPTFSMTRQDSSLRPLVNLYVGSGRTREDDLDTAATKSRATMTYQEASENPWG